jgi:hypothetical protein
VGLGFGIRRFRGRLGFAFLGSEHGVSTHNARRVRLDLSDRFQPIVDVDTATTLSSATTLNLCVRPERSLETLVPDQDFHQIAGRMLCHVMVDKVSYKLWKSFQGNWNRVSFTQDSRRFVGKFDNGPKYAISHSDTKSRFHQTSVPSIFHEIIEEESGVTVFSRLIHMRPRRFGLANRMARG